MVPHVSFVLRVNAHEQETLRGQIEHVPTGATAHFQGLAQAEQFVRRYLGAESAGPRRPESDTGEEVGSMFSFLRRPPGEGPRGEPEPQPGEPGAGPESAAPPPETLGDAAMAGGITPPISLRGYVDELLDLLRPFLPASGGGLPPNTLGVVSLNQRSLGVGGRRGMERSGGLDVAELRGGWLEAVLRYELWGADPATVGGLAATLQADLLAAAPTLRAGRLLQIRLADTADAAEAGGNWRRTVDYAVLYEYHYRDTDGAVSLIASVPIHGSTDFSGVEVTTVTDHMVRWDEHGAPALLIAPSPGQLLSVAGLTVAAFLPGGGPAGSVTRTIERGGETESVSFSSLAAFLSDFALPLTPIELLTLPPPLLPGETQAVRAFESRRRPFAPPVVLRGGDRLEVRFSEASFPTGSPAEVYLQAAVRG
jgi:hypothetical protein